MFSRARDFVLRHKKKFIVGGIVIGGYYLATSYLQRKLREFQEREYRKNTLFMATETRGRETVLSLMPALKKRILGLVDVEGSLAELKAGGKNKYVIWEELKYKVFAQLATLVYAGALLVLVIRVQLNILSGSKASQNSNSFSSENDHAYLTLCQHFIEKGVDDVYNLALKHAKEVLANTSLKSKVYSYDIERLFRCIHNGVMSDPDEPSENLARYLFAENVENLVDTPYMQNIVQRTVEALKVGKVKTTVKSALTDGLKESAKRLNSDIFNVTTSVAIPNGSASHRAEESLSACHFGEVIPKIHVFCDRAVSNIQETEFWVQPFLNLESYHEMCFLLFEAMCLQS